MRKIISILIALGLLLGLSVMAAPAQAADCAIVTISDPCAGATATYTINFTAPVTMLPGNDRLSVDFGGGSLAAVNASDIKVNGNVTTDIFISGVHVDFAIPAGCGIILAGSTVIVEIADVVNPAGGTYSLVLDYDLACCGPFDFCTVAYKIKLATTTYELLVDFDATYPGIAFDFVPPFKACGQNSTGTDYNTVLIGGNFYDQFDLIVDVLEAGCNLPCTNWTLFVDLVAYPTATAKASLNLTYGASTTMFALNSTSHSFTWTGINMTAANASASVTVDALLHFDTVGKGWKIYFKVFCPPSGTPTCANNCQTGVETLVAERTLTFDVYQWKDAEKIVLDEKWNLISLPLVPLIDPPIETLLASIKAADLAQIDSIWYYDNCAAVPEEDKWSMWPGGGLTDLVDGKAYWLKVMPYPQADCGNITWWLWGTEKPMPPASPAQYPVCEGWNMVGFLGTAANVSAYLWNWGAPTPVVYGWTHGCFASQGWVLKTAGDALTLGQGYWMAFPSDGAVYVP